MTEAPSEQRLRFTFRKEEGARFLSHLDLIATLEYSMRRARLPVVLSEGFNPRPKFSLAAPLAVGYTGERELLDITLRPPLDPAEALERLQAALPSGLKLTDCIELDAAVKGAASRVSGARYRVRLAEPVNDLPQRVTDLLARASIEQLEEREGMTRRRDIRPFIRAVEVPDTGTLLLSLAMTNAGSIRPETVLELLALPKDGAHVTREQLELD